MPHRSVPAMVISVALGLGTFVELERASEVSAAQTVKRPSGWTESTHGSEVKPDYTRLFGMNAVHELGITISPENHRVMQEDLQSIGIGRGGRGPGGAFAFPQEALEAAAPEMAAPAAVAAAVR